MTAANSTDASARRQAYQELIAVYWKPVYKYVRLRWAAGDEDAKDLTQEFFAAALEKQFFASYDPARSRFRTFLRVCVDGMAANAQKASRRIKRGGGTELLPLDFESAESELAAAGGGPADPEELFQQEWTRSLFGLAVDDLRAHCAAAGKPIHFSLFERYDLEPAPDGRPSYALLAAEFGISLTQVTNYLAFARAEFRRRVLDRLSRVCGSDEEFRREARRLFGTDPP